MLSLLNHPFMSVDPFHAFGPHSAWHRPLEELSRHSTLPLSDNAAFSTQSYTYSSRLGEDGRPVVRESRHAVNGQGRFRQEEYELRDGERLEHGTARAIGDRSVVSRSVLPGPDQREETHTAFNNLTEADAARFDEEWSGGSLARNPTCLLEERRGSEQRDRNERIQIEDRRTQQSSRR